MKVSVQDLRNRIEQSDKQTAGNAEGRKKWEMQGVSTDFLRKDRFLEGIFTIK